MHLGHLIVEASEYDAKFHPSIPIDDKKLTGLCFAMPRAFPSTARCSRVAPLVIRLGVKQVIHSKFLYPTTILDTNYELMDIRIRSSIRYMLGMPRDSCSAQLHADLGIWPSQYYAHERAMRMAYRIAHKYWTSSERGWIHDSNGELVPWGPRGWPKFLKVATVEHGVITRLGSILSENGLSWEVVYQFIGGEEDWHKKVKEQICQRFERYCQEAANEYKHPLLAFHEPRSDQPRIKIALRFGGELAVAALRMRCPSLRLRPGRDQGKCRYCGRGRENGRHLLVCKDIPPDLLASRIDILDSIKCQSGSVGLSSLAASDLALSFNWRHMESSLLKRLLVWCRNMINKYAAFIPEWERQAYPKLVDYPVHPARPRRR